MSAWGDRYGNGPAVAGAGGTRIFNGGGSGVPGQSTGGTYSPAPSTHGTSAEAQPEGPIKPGVVGVNLFDPAGSIEENANPIAQLLDGLKTGLFGTSQPDAEGKHGGLIGDLPVAGDIARAGSEAVSNVGGGLLGAAGEVIGGAAQRIPTGITNLDEQMQGVSDEVLDAEYKETGKTLRQLIEEDKGLLGTGIASTKLHYQAEAIKAQREADQFEDPTLQGGTFSPTVSVSQLPGFVGDLLGGAAQGAARWWADLETPGQGGMDRLDTIMAVGDGKIAFNPDTGIMGSGILAGGGDAGLNPLEELVYVKVKNGDWTRDEALDFLAAQGQAFGHSALANIGGSVAVDPLNIATFGAGAIAKAGATGAVIASRVAAAGEKASAANRVLDAAQLAYDAARAAHKPTKALKAELSAARAAADEAAATVEKFSKFTPSATPRAANVIARGASGSEGVQRMLTMAGKGYAGMQGTMVGRGAKLIRTIIDPLHALDLNKPGAARQLDVMSDAIQKNLVSVAGDANHLQLLQTLKSLDPTGATMDAFSKDLAIASANHAREGVGELYRQGQLNRRLGEQLMGSGFLPEDAMETALASIKERDLLKWLRHSQTENVIKLNWDDAAKQTLAQQMESTYGLRGADEWLTELNRMKPEQLSLLKHAAYGNANKALLNGIAASVGHPSAAKFPLDRLVLLAPDTLTRVGAESLLTKLSKPGLSVRKKVTIIREWQERFPALRYVDMSHGTPENAVDEFVVHLGNTMDRYPMQVTRDELGTMHEALQDVGGKLGGYRLGFRPEDKFLWGVERSNADGLYRPVGPVWVDHVADAGMGYRPGRHLRLNMVGHPIVDAPVTAAAKIADYMVVAGRTMKAQVSGAQVAVAARQRFVARGLESGIEGLNEGTLTKWWDRIHEYTREHQGYSGPRGFGAGELYSDLRKHDLIPQPLLNGSQRLAPHDVMRMVLEAYDGDVRTIGLTQKLSGRAKRYIFEATGSNFAGQIAEHVWPTMKFRLNPIFQLQEKIEPIVLNAQRGVGAATGMKMSETDIVMEQMLQRFTDLSLVRQADLDQAEFSAQVLFGTNAHLAAQRPGTAMSKVQSMARQLAEVQGMKRINMLRTARKGLGKQLRAEWENIQPGVWDDMKKTADLNAGRVLDEDDFAVSLLSEQQFANDIVLGRMGKAPDFRNAISTASWYAPADLGELRSLDMEHMAAGIGLVGKDGKDIRSLSDLRVALANGDRTMDDVRDALRQLNAHPDYIRRVEHALVFNWNGFWRTAAERFALSSDESESLQRMMAQAAELRGMTPVEFMSQVFAPGIVNGTEGMLGSIEGHVAILRQAQAAGRKVSPKAAKLKESRTVLAGKEGVSTRSDLVRQMAGAFADSLDPSAKRALLLEFQPELRQAILDGKVRFDLNDIEKMFDDVARSKLADRILGYMDGKPGTGKYKAVADDALGVADVRDGAARYMTLRGVTPLGERRFYEADELLSNDTAKAYSSLPSVPFERTGRRPTIQSIRKADTNLKPRPEGVDEATYAAFEDMVIETRAQWDHMTAPKSQGGMGIKVIVAKGDPYPNSAAMRADVAKGQLRVFAGNADHPLMTNEQNVMFRAVHDVFGHAAEGFEFGPRGELNAAIKHSQMYSDTARAAMLTETHGQNSWVNFSDDVIPGGEPQSIPLDEADPFADYESRHVRPVDEDDYVFEGIGFGLNDMDVPNTEFQFPAPTAIGDSLRQTDPEVARPVLQQMSDLQAAFPDYQLQQLDVMDNFEEPVEYGGLGLDMHTFGATWGGDQVDPVITLNPRFFGEDGAEAYEVANAKFDRSRNSNSFNGSPRVTPKGVPFNAMAGPEHTMRHEYGHVVLGRIRFGFGSRLYPENAAVNEVIDDFLKSGDVQFLSEYAARGGDEGETTADLFSVAMATPEQRAAAGISPAIEEWADKLRQSLIDSGHMKPVGLNPNAGKTVREVNASAPGSVYAEQKAALLPQDILDRFGEQFVGRGKHVESNPDVARTAQMFGKWSEAVINNGLLRGEKGVYGELLGDIAGIPTGAATPFNHTEGILNMLASQTMARKWDDAFRLQYFAQDRSMLERSINHPMFGLYPASYMFGKVMPELVRFISSEPFGVKTGGLLYSIMDAQAAVAIQREYDPVFDQHIEDLGHSQALSFLGYMLPSLPWDISASAPTWFRDIADQGLRSEKAVAAGEEAEDFNALKPLTDTVKKLNPLETTLPWGSRAVGELQGGESDVDEPVQATELSEPLSRVMQELQEALAS